MPRAHPFSPFRTLTVALLLCVLAMRVAIPTGYMLDPAAQGWPGLIACPAAAPLPAMAHGHHTMASKSHHHQHDKTTADHPCAFAAASAAVDLTALAQPALLPGTRIEPASLLHLFARPGLGLAAPPPPKTGPPALA